jgi:hypothetical protein
MEDLQRVVDADGHVEGLAEPQVRHEDGECIVAPSPEQ